jgi:ABC-type Fe3+-hydroxamate transport system substrate-binding protein
MQITDQLNNQLTIDHPPQRIVSLVPSQTELLYDLGLGKKLAGVTKFCVHPEDIRSRTTVIGGTKDPDLERIQDLKPDLVIANKEENREQDIRTLMTYCPVYVSDVTDRESALQMILHVGKMTYTSEKAIEIISGIESAFKIIIPSEGLTAIYIIWNNPMMLAGEDTFIDAMLKECGIKNAYSGKERYAEITADDVCSMDPDLIMLSSEPFPFSEKHVDIYTALNPRSRVILVDGESFSWYGSRMRTSATYLSEFSSSLKNKSKTLK